MDLFRRRAGGRLAELLGRDALAEDVEYRVLGVRRAAERSLAELGPATREALDAYAEGVNAFLAEGRLPPEYGALQLTRASVEPWTALDSVAVAKLAAFGLSFDLDDIARTETLLAYQAAGRERGFDGAALFFEDINRVEPFTDAATIPDARSRGRYEAAAAEPRRGEGTRAGGRSVPTPIPPPRPSRAATSSASGGSASSATRRQERKGAGKATPGP
jgi:penicillin amidase